MEKKRNTVEVTVLEDGTALVDIPEGELPDQETIKRICEAIKQERAKRLRV